MKNTTHIVLSINGDDYLLPEGADLPTILNSLAGIRKVRTEYLYPSGNRVLIDGGEAEFSVGAMHRELVNTERFAELRAEEEKLREASK